MADKSKIRMNLSAIKKVDPYAKDIVDSSSHVAFYTFNSEQNEWEKTDVEGAFFVYSRNGQPFHSIFINNRLNTNSFVEPITYRLELQLQSPFLLYRNERSRIRGFWFYNSQECERIGNLVSKLIQQTQNNNLNELKEDVFSKHTNVNIFNMLSKAQQEYNDNSTIKGSEENASHSVLKFFAAAKPTSCEIPLYQRMLQNTLSVEQIEKQQRSKTPQEKLISLNQQRDSLPFESLSCTVDESNLLENLEQEKSPALSTIGADLFTDLKILENQKQNSNILESGYEHLINKTSTSILSNEIKPALMPPTMFGKTNDTNKYTIRPETLSKTQMVQALSYLIENDNDFVQKLHEAYLKHLNCT